MGPAAAAAAADADDTEATEDAFDADTEDLDAAAEDSTAIGSRVVVAVLTTVAATVLVTGAAAGGARTPRRPQGRAGIGDRHAPRIHRPRPRPRIMPAGW